VNLVGNGILTLLRNPAELERLRNNFQLIPSAVEEILRYEPPESAYGSTGFARRESRRKKIPGAKR